MNIAQAKLAGLNAFIEGRARAPATNQKFLVVACASEHDTSELLAAYLYGWDIGNLSTNAIPGAPSIESRAKIIADAK